jgi:hypothetical protein
LTELPAQYEQLQLQLVKGRQTPVTCYRVMMPANDLRVSSKGTNTADTSEV